jgi:hypothetical protein
MSAPKKFVITGLSAAALVATIGYAYAQSADDSALGNTNFNGTQNSADTYLSGPPAMPAAAAAQAPGGSADTSATAPAYDSGSMATRSDTDSQTGMTTPSTDASGNPLTAPDTTSSTSTGSTGTSMGEPTAPMAQSDTTVPAADNRTAGTSPEKVDMQHPATGAPSPNPDASRADTMSNGSMTTNTGTVPSAASPSTSTSTYSSPTPAATSTETTTSTRVELNSPNEPQYNLASDPWLRGNRHNATANASNHDNASADNSTGTRAPRADRN